MSIKVPVAVNYQTPMNFIAAKWTNESPPEGPALVPIDIDWASMGGPNNCININLFGQSAETLSQIVALSVDNSDCAVDVRYIFTDTAQTYTVPARQGITTFPVFTNGTQMFVEADGAAAGDETRFSIHNLMPPAVSVPLSVELEAVVFNAIPVATGNTQLIAPGTDGIVQGLIVTFQWTATTCNDAWTIQDGNGTVLAGGQDAASDVANSNVKTIGAMLTGLNLRFVNGLKFVQNIGAGTPAGSLAAVNVFTRQ